MRKSKVLSVAMSSVLVAALAAATSVSVSAEITKSADIPSHKVGVVGSFNGWDNDVELTDADGDGVYEGTVEVEKVTEDMIVGWNVDDEPTGESYLQFKVRLDGEWTDSWGNYEPKNDRCWNSQSNVPVKEAKVGEPITFTVYFDIKHPSPAALANPDSYVEGENDDSYDYLNVYYKVVEKEPEPASSSEPEPAPSSTPESSVESTTGPATVTSTDSTAPATGDATSAAALAAVVVASLGIAVVMTKKASAK